MGRLQLQGKQRPPSTCHGSSQHRLREVPGAPSGMSVSLSHLSLTNAETARVVIVSASWTALRGLETAFLACSSASLQSVEHIPLIALGMTLGCGG